MTVYVFSFEITTGSAGWLFLMLRGGYWNQTWTSHKLNMHSELWTICPLNYKIDFSEGFNHDILNLHANFLMNRIILKGISYEL